MCSGSSPLLLALFYSTASGLTWVRALFWIGTRQIPTDLQTLNGEASKLKRQCSQMGGKEDLERESNCLNHSIDNSVFDCVEISSALIHRSCCSSDPRQKEHVSLRLAVSVWAIQERDRRQTGVRSVNQDVFICQMLHCKHFAINIYVVIIISGLIVLLG